MGNYVVVDVFADIVTAVKAALALPVLNYQYGYVEELNETLQQYSKTPEFSLLKFPLVWLRQPFDVERNSAAFFGTIRNMELFIINESAKAKKAKDRMQDNFKPVLYPVYEELLRQIALSPAISYEATGNRHTVTDRYYWGEQQQSVLNDVVDCLQISRLEITINNKNNC